MSSHASVSSSAKAKLEVRRLTARILLSEMWEFIGEEQCDKVNRCFKDYHKSLSSNNSSEQSEKAVESLKSKISSLLDGNESLHLNFIEFLPLRFRGMCFRNEL